MGPWAIRDEDHPFRPGCSYETIRDLVARGKITPNTIVRGPPTNQFWALAKRTPGVAHLLGACHNCGHPARATDFLCGTCGAAFGVDQDRQHMGLLAMQMLPGKAPAPIIAASTAPLSAVMEEVESPFVRENERGGGGQERAPEGARPAHRPRPLVAPLCIAGVLASALVGYLVGKSGVRERGAIETGGEEVGSVVEEIAKGGGEQMAGETPTLSNPDAAQETPRESEEAVFLARIRALVNEDSVESLGTALELLRIESKRGDTSRWQPWVGAVERRLRLKRLRDLP